MEDIHNLVVNEAEIHVPKGFTEADATAGQMCPVKQPDGSYLWVRTDQFSGIQGPAGDPAPIFSTSGSINNPSDVLSGKKPTDPGYATSIRITQPLAGLPNRTVDYTFDVDVDPGAIISPIAIEGDGGSWVLQDPQFFSKYSDMVATVDTIAYHGLKPHTHSNDDTNPNQEGGSTWVVHAGGFHDFVTSNTKMYQRIISGARTGVVKYNAPGITINGGDDTKIDHTEYDVDFVNNYTDNTVTVRPIRKTLAAATDIAVTGVGVTPVTFFSVEDDGGLTDPPKLLQRPTFPTEEQLATEAFLGVASHPAGAILPPISNNPQQTANPVASIGALSRSLRLINKDANIKVKPGTTGLKITRTAGDIHSVDGNRSNSEKNPDVMPVAEAEDTSMGYSLRNAGVHSIVTGFVVIPVGYDNNNGSVTALSAGKWVVHRPSYSPGTDALTLQIGQEQYDTFLDALVNNRHEVFSENPSLGASSIKLDRIFIRQGTTDWLTASNFRFHSANRFGDLAGMTTGVLDLLKAERVPLVGVEVDHSDGEIRTKTLTGNTTLSIVNPRLFKTVLLEITSTVAETLDFPASVKIMEGAYDNSGVKNYIRLFCSNADTPEYLAYFEREGGSLLTISRGLLAQGGISEYFNVAAYTFLINATDEILPLDSLKVEDDTCTALDDVNDEIDLLKAGKYRVRYHILTDAFGSTSSRRIDSFVEINTGGPFVEIPDSRSYASDVNNGFTRQETLDHGGFTFDANANDSIRLVANCSVQATNTRVEKIIISIEYLGA